MATPTNDQILDFVGKIDVMKPNKAAKDNLKHKTQLDMLLDDPNWALEEKIDGCHYLMVACRFFSADKVEKTNNFPHLRDFFMKLGMVNLILDGEINYPGKTSQYCTHVTGSLPDQASKFQDINGYIHYTIFDILRTPKGSWALNVSYARRRAFLERFYNELIKGTPMEQYIKLSERRVDDKRDYLNNLLDQGLEGGVLKHLESKYVMGKKPMWQWMKIKQEDETDLVVMGFDAATVEYKGKNMDTHPYWKEINGVSLPVTKYHYWGWIGAVRLGAYVDGVLTQICTASGMNETVREHMTNHPDEYIGKVVRVRFMERTEAGYPRHPVFVNVHEAKKPEECIWDFNPLNR